MFHDTAISLTVAATAELLQVLSSLKDTGEKKLEYTPKSTKPLCTMEGKPVCLTILQYCYLVFLFYLYFLLFAFIWGPLFLKMDRGF